MSSDKNDKYDRQMRLWGGHGQECLAKATVIVLGTTPAATETLKNLVLPGVGYFIIVDDHVVTERDLGNNFFVDGESLGKPQCEVVCQLMLEMNPDVKGIAVNMAIKDFIDKKSDEILGAQMVIACELTNTYAARLGDLCKQKNIPMLLLRQYGMIGYIRLYKQETCIIESKIASVKPRDIRVYNPWLELKAFADSFELATLDELLFIHVPYAVILIKALDKWKATHGGKAPSTFAEKNEFKASITAMNRFGKKSLNFEEALQNVTDCYKTDELRPHIRGVFDRIND